MKPLHPVAAATAIAIALLSLACVPPATAQSGADYEADVRVALAEIPKQCGEFLQLKGIDWNAVSAQFLEEVKDVRTDQDHLVLLVRLMARLKDGHASVIPTEKGKSIQWPDQAEKVGPGMFWCRIGKDIYVKNAWGSAAAAGVTPGMQVEEVNGDPVDEWLAQRSTELADLMSFSTPHQQFFYTTHWGLKDAPGTEMELELKPLRGGREDVKVEYRNDSHVPHGPAFYPGKVERTANLYYTKTEAGWGYIHVRRCKGDLPAEMSQALAGLGEVPGLILDFRGNSGGGFDHDDFMGRFIPRGKTLTFNKSYASTGESPYGGPVVLVIDATIRSAGETAVAIFKEDGRGYVIGESPSAGMSSSKATIELPSGLFSLYVSIHSNMSRSNDGRGLEGVGVIPHEIVEFDPKDLAEEKDTLILKAESLLENFPQDKVPYNPADFGWQAP